LAQYYQINIQLLDKLLTKPISEWPLFSKEEFRNTIKKCNNLPTLGFDHVS